MSHAIHRENMGQILLRLSLLGLACAFILTPMFTSAELTRSPNLGSQPLRLEKVERLGELPVAFEPNHGQIEKSVNFFGRANGYQIFLTNEEAIFVLDSNASEPNGQDQPSVIRMKLDNTKICRKLRGQQPLPGKVNYFIGQDPSSWYTEM